MNEVASVVVQLPELVVWSASIFALTMVGMSIRQEMLSTKIVAVLETLAKIKSTGEAVLNMHEHADDYGFGTRQTNSLLKIAMQVQKDLQDESRTIQTRLEADAHSTRQSLVQLVNLLRYDIEQRTGKKVPPPFNGDTK